MPKLANITKYMKKIKSNGTIGRRILLKTAIMICNSSKKLIKRNTRTALKILKNFKKFDILATMPAIRNRGAP